MKNEIKHKLLSLSISGLLTFSVAICFTGCIDYLTEDEPGMTKLEDYYTSGTAAIQNVTGCYVPLMWEFNHTYYSEWFIGDVASDDALKGGQNTNDMASVYDIENWKTTIDNDLLLEFYRAQYQGIARCNMALAHIPDMAVDSVMTISVKNRLLGEVHFLRAYYYFRLLRIFGGVPLADHVINSDAEWNMPRASIADMFQFIIDDLTFANANLWKKSQYDAADLGRATKGAAQAMLQKTYLYMAGDYWNKHINGESPTTYYTLAKQWGDSVILSNEYNLVAPSEYEKMFMLAGENGDESLFEIQYMAHEEGDYGEGNGFTVGTFTQVLVRSRSTQIGSGWGFNHPTWNLYNEFEDGDIRRDIAILNPDPALMDNVNEETYLGSALLNNKYGAYKDLPGGVAHAARGPLNNKQIRYADVLLMQAEICAGLNDAASATAYLNEVRIARGMATYPGYTYTTTTPSTGDALTDAIRHERRCELAMEGHRWFDIVRWGKTKQTMDEYAKTEDEQARFQMGTFIEGKHEIFPIPQKEIMLNSALTQNDLY